MDTQTQYHDAKVFKYKLDFYYQQSLLYLITLVFYGGIRGTITFERMPTLVSDPILYIIILFVIISFVVLMLNRARDRKLIIADAEIIFHNKFREQHIPLSSIEWLHIGRESGVRTAGRSQMVIFKMRDRRRWFRVRIGRYEREKELLREIHRIAGLVPKMKRPLMGIRRSI